MNVVQDRQNPLLKRREVKVVVEAEKNPSMKEAAEIIAKQFKTGEEKAQVKLVRGKFGRNTFLIVANIYDSKEDKEKIEPKQKKGKGGEQKTEDAPAEQAEPEPKQEDKS